MIARCGRAAKYIAVLLTFSVLFPNSGRAEAIAAKHKEGPSHGFLVVRTLEGKAIATGDLVQTMKGGRIISHMIFHFKDGSLYDEMTEFTQRGTFRLLRDHLIEKGPSFKTEVDTLIDATSGQITMASQDKDGKEKKSTKHMDLPPDTYNGLVWTILKNIGTRGGNTTVSMVSGSDSPRLVKLHLIPEGEEPFLIGTTQRKATHFAIKVEITGVAGVVAPLVGKKPPEMQAWILEGEAPAFLKMEGPLFDDGPLWRVERTAPVGPEK
jgi:hypothetical protein